MRPRSAFRPGGLFFSYLILMPATFAMAAETNLEVGDAYVRGSADGQQWSIGTKAIEMAFDCRNGAMGLANFKNKLVSGQQEYVDQKTSAAPFQTATRPLIEQYDIETVWAKPLVGPIALDPAADNIRIAVKRGQMIGFSVGPHGDYSSDQVRWPATFDYGDGQSFTSTSDPDVGQGPMWFYMIRLPNTGWMEPMDSVEFTANVREKIRIPSEKSGFRAPGTTPHVGPQVLHPSNEFDAVRVWAAPKDGLVTVRGKAEHVGMGDVDLSVVKIARRPDDEPGRRNADGRWTIQSGAGRQVAAGGRPAAQLDLVLVREGIRADFHVLAFPGTPILRQWVEYSNTGKSGEVLFSPAPASFSLRGEDASAYTQYWMIGGNSQPNQGKMERAAVAQSYHRKLDGSATANYVPWTALHRTTDRKDGWFMALDYLGRWCLSVDREAGGPLIASASLIELRARTLAPGERIAMPPVTIGVFRDDLDDMGRSLYDWQYEYMWDYTNADWHSLMQITTAWWPDSRNLQEQFAGRLAYLDMDWTEYIREAGLDLLWDDAGWAANPDIWAANREGPDYAQTVRYVAKTGMKWCLWFPGDPTAGIMDTKVGSWGSFQWRTDAMGFNFNSDKAFREEVARFLRAHPRCSWHTCSGGSTYSHTFDIQRLGDVHYDTDCPGSDITNYYFSYLETPDKAFDNLAEWVSCRKFGYDSCASRRMLTLVPKWGLYIKPDEIEQLRMITDLYRYLVKVGVAGRWSYMTHPVIKGDTEHYYSQRVSHDRRRSLVILKHCAPGEVTIYPRGLLPTHDYLVEFDSSHEAVTRSGADLMGTGIAIKHQKPGELIYLNLADRPRSDRDKTPPGPPGRVVSRYEVNLGFCGVGIYWSPGSDDNWVSRYEVRRGDQILGQACTGTYFFDRSAGWNPKAQYQVRTVDGDGNVSAWLIAKPLPDEPSAYSVLGGHFGQAGRDGWKAETTTDLHAFAPMIWVPPAKPPSTELGGTSNQRGGAEGYWEGAGSTRLGRGWQQASKDAMCVRTWVAPRPGNVQIIGRVMKEYYHRDQGGPLRVCILHNDRKVWPSDDWAVAPVGNLTGVTHDLSLEVAAGDAIRFLLDKGTVPEHDLLAWMPRIIYPGDQSAGQPLPVVRILCGAKEAYTDRCGNVWSADQYFVGGEPVSTTAGIDGATPTPDDQPLYKAGRAGKEFTYSIPVPEGLYSLRLKFAEPGREWFFERPFNLDINGRRVLTDLDICHAAQGPRRAYEKVFRYLSPDADGRLVMHFTSGWGPTKAADEAIVQAIEVLPEDKSVIRINVGSDSPFVDWNAFVWGPDAHYDGGRTIRSDAPVTQASPTLYDQELYRTARTGRAFSYAFPAKPGLYTVHLKFAELWLEEPGKRPMDIEINGRRVWTSWDPATAAGRLGMAADIRVEDIAPGKNGTIRLQITAAGPNDVILQGIEIE